MHSGWGGWSWRSLIQVPRPWCLLAETEAGAGQWGSGWAGLSLPRGRRPEPPPGSMCTCRVASGPVSRSGGSWTLGLGLLTPALQAGLEGLKELPAQGLKVRKPLQFSDRYLISYSIKRRFRAVIMAGAPAAWSCLCHEDRIFRVQPQGGNLLPCAPQRTAHSWSCKGFLP